MARRYELKQRAEQVQETRRRIVEATVELHRTLGPAATPIAEVARRAGVQRRTVYNHFPDERALFAACSAHWRAQHPPPDPGSWRDARHGLRELYAWYRETEPMTANVLRDLELLPALKRVIDPGLGAYLEHVRRTLAAPYGRSRRVERAAAVATDVHVWQTLAPLGDAQAADLATRFIEAAAARRSRSGRRG